MFNDACVPDVGGPQLLDFGECLAREVGHFAAAIFLQCSVWYAAVVIVAKEARQHLIDDDFFGGMLHSSVIQPSSLYGGGLYYMR